MDKKAAEVGIITFHCSNNYGAMLQAYGLKRFLRDNGIRAEIVRYEPPYMTGRHWWAPYAPLWGPLGCMYNMWKGFWAHMRIREEFARQRENMDRFRREYLLEKGQRKILFGGGMRNLPYRYYIVGSDQIWNPDITCGLRKVYFGAFQSKRKEKVISYGASVGGTSINPKYDTEFAQLVSHIDVLSVREAAAILYVKKFYKGEVRAVLDPVFLPEREVWQEMEKAPDKEGYILVYMTERNKGMEEYIWKLSREKNLPVLEVQMERQWVDKGFELDITIGPAEFLGYIRHAEYVVTNSFHAVAFSIIYQKKFMVFAHRSLSARLQNVLQIYGLEDRMSQGNDIRDIDAPVDWRMVQCRDREAVQDSRAFLLGNLL